MSNQPAPLSVARYKDLIPYQSHHADKGIPREVMEYLAANKVFPLFSPVGLVGRNALAPLRGWPGLCMTIAQCTPNQGPVSHNHTGTLETFFCLDGRFDVLWGNDLEHKVTLEPGDLCSVPPNVYRAFRNLVQTDARLLVLIQGDDKMSDKIEMLRAIGEGIRQKHGDETIELLASINMRFQGEPADDIPENRMLRERIVRSTELKPIQEKLVTTYPILSNDEKSPAPVKCWPGMDVSMLKINKNEVSRANVDKDHCEWIFNIGTHACEVIINNQKLTLEQYDLVCAPSDSQREIRNISDKVNCLLSVSQGKKTITAEEISAIKASQALH